MKKCFYWQQAYWYFLDVERQHWTTVAVVRHKVRKSSFRIDSWCISTLNNPFLFPCKGINQLAEEMTPMYALLMPR